MVSALYAMYNKRLNMVILFTKTSKRRWYRVSIYYNLLTAERNKPLTIDGIYNILDDMDTEEDILEFIYSHVVYDTSYRDTNGNHHITLRAFYPEAFQELLHSLQHDYSFTQYTGEIK